MKLRKDQRYTAYCIMLEESENNWKSQVDEQIGLCGLTYDIFGLFPVSKGDYRYWLYPEDDDVEFESFMPELWGNKPNDDGFWFPRTKSGWEERARLLQQCIEETSDF